MKYILVNLKTNNEEISSILDEVKSKLSSDFKTLNVMDVDYLDFLKSLAKDDEVILVGGDGTINYFINAIEGYEPQNNIYLYPAGTGNDFYNDVTGKTDRELVKLNEYLRNLPTVEVNGQKKKFINGIGYGIDGYCCEVGDKLRAENKKVNYTGIAIKGLLFHFKPLKATVTVDNQTTTYENVWLAPTMKGRFYGGGMMVAPSQFRLKGNSLTTVVYKTRSKLKALIVFPSIFKGEHIKHEKIVKILTGTEIEVKFNRPCALQIDGETVLGVTSYKVKA